MPSIIKMIPKPVVDVILEMMEHNIDELEAGRGNEAAYCNALHAYGDLLISISEVDLDPERIIKQVEKFCARLESIHREEVVDGLIINVLEFLRDDFSEAFISKNLQRLSIAKVLPRKIREAVWEIDFCLGGLEDDEIRHLCDRFVNFGAIVYRIDLDDNSLRKILEELRMALIRLEKLFTENPVDFLIEDRKLLSDLIAELENRISSS